MMGSIVPNLGQMSASQAWSQQDQWWGGSPRPQSDSEITIGIDHGRSPVVLARSKGPSLHHRGVDVPNHNLSGYYAGTFGAQLASNSLQASKDTVKDVLKTASGSGWGGFMAVISPKRVISCLCALFS
jgi:hypothetical protein